MPKLQNSEWPKLVDNLFPPPMGLVDDKALRSLLKMIRENPPILETVNANGETLLLKLQEIADDDVLRRRVGIVKDGYEGDSMPFPQFLSKYEKIAKEMIESGYEEVRKEVKSLHDDLKLQREQVTSKDEALWNNVDDKLDSFCHYRFSERTSGKELIAEFKTDMDATLTRIAKDKSTQNPIKELLSSAVNKVLSILGKFIPALKSSSETKTEVEQKDEKGKSFRF